MFQAIELQFVETKHINDSTNQKAFKSVLQFFNNISYQASYFENKCIHPYRLLHEHEKNVEQAFMHISPLQVCDSNNQTLRQVRSFSVMCGQIIYFHIYYTDLTDITSSMIFSLLQLRS